jgi:hypothetical protein
MLSRALNQAVRSSFQLPVLPKTPLSYGDAVGVGTVSLAFSFSRARAAFAVACCKRSESDFNRSASGVDCGFTLLSCLSEREQPAMARSMTDNITSENFFIT